MYAKDLNSLDKILGDKVGASEPVRVPQLIMELTTIRGKVNDTLKRVKRLKEVASPLLAPPKPREASSKGETRTDDGSARSILAWTHLMLDQIDGVLGEIEERL